MKKSLVLTGLLVLGGGSAAVVAADTSTLAPLVRTVLACRSVTDDPARLSCFDRAVGDLEVALGRNEVVVVDKATMREARKGIFGFSLPRIKLFEGGDESDEPVQSIEAKLTAIGTTSSGGLLLTLDSGARWQQVDSEFINKPKPGQTVVIRRGAIGGYMAKIEGGRGFRVRRLAE